MKAVQPLRRTKRALSEPKIATQFMIEVTFADVCSVLWGLSLTTWLWLRLLAMYNTRNILRELPSMPNYLNMNDLF